MEENNIKKKQNRWKRAVAQSEVLKPRAGDIFSVGGFPGAVYLYTCFLKTVESALIHF